MKYIICLLLILCADIGHGQSIDYKPGKGVHLVGADTSWNFGVMGYIQGTWNYYHPQTAVKPDHEFFVRRAVTDFEFIYQDKYRFFMEIDARGESRYEMVIAQIDIQYAKHHHLVVGKYMTPFSPENHRTSRALNTIERYSALNSMFKLPSMTSQYGVMLNGKIRAFDYYLGFINGNGTTSKNIREDNNAKEIQARVRWNVSPDLKCGTGFDYSKENQQVLGLWDHTFEIYSRDTISGKRLGYLLEYDWTIKNWSFRGEGIQFFFSDRFKSEKRIGQFYGGYIETGYFLSGNAKQGFQLIGRFERAQLMKTHDGFSGPKRSDSFIIGHNWYFNELLRWQTNVIYDKLDRKVVISDSRYNGRKNGYQILSMLQMKF